MGRLIYMMNVSLDGFVETPDHSIDWGTVDEELHLWFNDHARRMDASIYGRRMYEVMAGYWPTAETDAEATPAMVEFARIWNATPKVVFSTTLTEVLPSARIERGDLGDVLARLREEFPGDLEVSGPTLAAGFIERGLVDEFQLLVHPVAIGAGTPYFPQLEGPTRLELVETRTFTSGVVHLRYRKAERS